MVVIIHANSLAILIRSNDTENNLQTNYLPNRSPQENIFYQKLEEKDLV